VGGVGGVGEVGEVAGTAGTAGIGDPAVASAPVALWGFRPGWTSDPAPCGVLADPAPQPRAVRGLSASGSGGIVYVVATAGAHAGVDPGLLDGCGRWRLTSGHSAATVELVGAPEIPGAVTVGLSASITTAVESGTQTEARAHTFVAYLPDSTAAVTLINDPGSPKPPLSPRYAADLLVATVSELRG
uniref:DUF5642 family protein n=1 Tax=Mycolicibacterium palauense TaxID=2034511 RepID=UPI001C3F3B1B